MWAYRAAEDARKGAVTNRRNPLVWRTFALAGPGRPALPPWPTVRIPPQETFAVAAIADDTGVRPNTQLADALATGQYDFLDYGSSGGSSFDLAVKKLGLTNGIGLDLD